MDDGSSESEMTDFDSAHLMFLEINKRFLVPV